MNKKKKIIGFDPGLTTTGWGLIENFKNREFYITHGLIRSNEQKKLSIRLNLIYENVFQLVKKYSPDFIAVEKIFSNKNPSSTLKLGKARAIIFLVAGMCGIEVFEYSPNTVKKNLVGYGHAEKQQMIEMIKRFFPDLKTIDHNAADALAVAICHSMHMQSKINFIAPS